MSQRPDPFALSSALRERLLDLVHAEHADEVTAVDCLRVARQLVQTTHGRLNTESTVCGECGLTHYVHYTHVKAAERTAGVLQRLTKLINENPWEQTDTEKLAPNEAPRGKRHGTKRTKASRSSG
jgi:hypothetical protein